MKAVILLFCLLLPACATSFGEKWSSSDTARQLAANALLTTDWGQTLYVADHPGKFYETNPIIGRHPSRGRVNRYFAAANILHPLISASLKPEAREYWQYITIGLESGVVAHNINIGVGLRW